MSRNGYTVCTCSSKGGCRKGRMLYICMFIHGEQASMMQQTGAVDFRTLPVNSNVWTLKCDESTTFNSPL